MADCPNFKDNLSICTCTYDPCSRKGRCCQCMAYHRRMEELPACYFSKEAERSYDRSIAGFLSDRQGKR